MRSKTRASTTALGFLVFIRVPRWAAAVYAYNVRIILLRLGGTKPELLMTACRLKWASRIRRVRVRDLEPRTSQVDRMV